MKDNRSFFAEITRRNVHRAAVFYAASAWLVVQVAADVFPVFGIPDAVVRWVIVLLTIGFPCAMLFSWFYEWTPTGIKKESEIDIAESITHLTGRKMDRYIVAVLMLVLVVLLADRLVTPPRAIKSDPSVAVLPLTNEGGNPENEYFSDGLTEELIAVLGQIPKLKVIGRNSSFRFKDSTTDSRTIGNLLGVAHLLEGRVRRFDQRIRIVVGLVRVADNRQLWGQTYDRAAGDIFAVQAEIAEAVAQALQLTMLDGDQRAAPQPARTVEAHNAFLQGHFFLERSSFEGWHRAIEYYDEAIRLDPDYALAYAERATATTWLATRNPPNVASLRAAARRDAERGIALDERLAEAHAALGLVRFYLDWNFAGAARELKRAEELAPNNPRSKYRLAQVQLFQGSVDDATALAIEAAELDPLSYSAHNVLARVLMAQGQHNAAEAQGRKAAELQPTAVASRRWQVIGAVLRGDAQTALREAALEGSQASATGPTQGFRKFEFALAHYADGNTAESDAALASLIANDSDSMAYQIAEVYAWRGDTDEAFQWLRRSYDSHDAGTLGMLADPLLRRLHDDPRFDDMLAELGLELPDSDSVLRSAP
ncbi:MAG: hypothetical protein AAFN78_18630 [Pseudomonadota bacterium]